MSRMDEIMDAAVNSQPVKFEAAVKAEIMDRVAERVDTIRQDVASEVFGKVDLAYEPPVE